MERPNIVLIVLDTLRKDGLGCYSNNARTPFFDKFCSEAQFYRNAIAPSPWTVPSHVSFFTGKYASDHGVHEEMKGNVYPDVYEKLKTYSGELLAEKLKKKGYSNLGITSNDWIGPGTGFDRGFNAYMYNSGPIDTLLNKIETELRPEIKKYGSNFYEIAKNAVKGKINSFSFFKDYLYYRKMNRNLEDMGYPENKDGGNIVNVLKNASLEQPFFLFLNFMEAHEPYRTLYRKKKKYASVGLLITALYLEGKLNPDLISDTLKDYYRESFLLDRFVSDIVQYIKEEGAFENTLFIVTSDHGQELLEKGFFGHGIFLHDEIIDVPLIIKYPENYKPIKGADEKYFNIKDLFDLIDKITDGENPEDVQKDITFSESFGSNVQVSALSVLDGRLKSKLEGFVAPRKAVYKKGYKLVVNGLSGDVEEFKRGEINKDPKDEKEMFNEMLDELYFFKGKEKFNLPKRL
ncbi:MAG: sulfatase [Nitrososphaeria archaeon]